MVVRKRWTLEEREVGRDPICSILQVNPATSAEEIPLAATTRDGADAVLEDIMIGKFNWNLVISSVRNSKKLKRTYKRGLKSSYGRKKEDNGHESV